MSVAEPSPANPNLPQLAVAKNPKLMRDLFQKHLRPLGERAYRVQECEVSRIRYQQGIRCVLQYTLYLEEPSTGYERTQWITGVIHAEDGQTRQEWEKLRRSKSGRETLNSSPTFVPFRWLREKLRISDPRGKKIPGAAFAAFEPFCFISELQMLMQVFPYDQKLPSLPLLIEGPPPELKPSLLDRFGPGEWQAEAWEIETVRYRAELRATLRLTVRALEEATGRVEQRRFYAKVYRPGQDIKRTYEVLQALWKRAEMGGEGFTVGRPVACQEDLQTLVQEEVSGTSLQEMLVREEEVAPTMRRVARALVALHLDKEVSAPQRSRPWKEKEIAALKRVEKLLGTARPHLGPEIEEIVGTVAAGLEEEVPTTPTHGDLHPRHIMLDGDRLVLLDLDDFVEADPVRDVAHLLAPLAIMSLRFPVDQDRMRTAAEAFNEEYFAHVPEAWRARFPLHYAGATLRMAGGIFRRQESDWPQKIETLVKGAKGSLIGRV